MGKLQDILSGLKQIGGKAASSAVKDTAKKLASEKPDDSLWGKLKSFAKSDTGKTLGMAVGTIAAGRYGGAEGINALTSAIEKSRMKKKEEEREAERQQDLKETRDLRKVNMARAELDLERGREDLNTKKNQNYADLQQKIMSAGMGLPQVTGKITGGKSGGTGTEPKLPQPPQPTPVSINDPEAVQKGEIDAAQWAAKLMAQSGLIGVGKDVWNKNREQMNQELINTGLTKEQQAAAWKEMTRLAMPGRYEQIPEEMAAAADPDYTWGEGGAKFQESAFKSAGTAGGAMLGASIGTGMLPGIGTVAGGLIGAGIGYAGSRALGDITFSGQADAVSTPAVAGADKSAAEDMATYQDDNRYAMQIARGLERSGAGPQDTDQIMAQLSQIPGIAENKERRDKIIKLVRWHFYQKPGPASQWMNERAWR